MIFTIFHQVFLGSLVWVYWILKYQPLLSEIDWKQESLGTKPTGESQLHVAKTSKTHNWGVTCRVYDVV